MDPMSKTMMMETEMVTDSSDDDSAKLDKILNSITDISERVEKLEGTVEKVKKQPEIKNQKLLQKIQKDRKVKTFLNRGE